VIADSWQALLEEVKKTVDSIEPDLRILDANKLLESTKRINGLVDSQRDITVGVEVGFLFKLPEYST
jgi:hypothetical protein